MDRIARFSVDFDGYDWLIRDYLKLNNGPVMRLTGETSLKDVLSKRRRLESYFGKLVFFATGPNSPLKTGRL